MHFQEGDAAFNKPITERSMFTPSPSSKISKDIQHPSSERLADGMMFVLLFGLCVASRLIEHPENFVAVGAAALFAGWRMKNRMLAFAAPVLGMLVSDLFLGFYQLPLVLVVYSSMVLPVWLGGLVSRSWKLRLIPFACASGLYHFVFVNYAVWHTSTLYEKSASGLLTCYAAGVPFSLNKLGGDIFWSAILFGLFAAYTALSENQSRQTTASVYARS